MSYYTNRMGVPSPAPAIPAPRRGPLPRTRTCGPLPYAPGRFARLPASAAQGIVRAVAKWLVVTRSRRHHHPVFMRRRIAALLTSLLLVQFVLVGNGGVCADHGSGSVHEMGGPPAAST